MTRNLVVTLLISLNCFISYQINGMDKPTQVQKKSAQDIIQRMRDYTEDPARRSDEFIKANPPAEKTALTREDVSDLFFLACKSKKSDLLDQLKSKIPVSLASIRCRTSKITLLHEAALDGNYDVVQFLLNQSDCKSLINNQENTIGATPAMMAAVKGHILVLRYLMALNANLHLLDKAGRSIGHYASWELPVIMILEKYALPTLLYPDRDGNTPLTWAQNSKSIRVQNYLEKMYADVLSTNSLNKAHNEKANISIQP